MPPSLDEIGQVTNLFAKQNIHERPVERLNQLSSEERVQALNDLHGVSLLPDESPEILGSTLKQLDEEINNLLASLGSETHSYIEALRQNPKYVKGLRLKFLRAEKLVPREAARRMVKHFKMKERLFGREKLGKDLDFLDLSERDRALFRLGYAQLSIKRDRAGRAIVFLSSKAFEYPIEFLVRFKFFIISTLSNNDEILRKGVIIICHGIGQEQLPRAEEILLLVENFPAVIGRVNAIHICYDSKIFDAFFKLGNWSLESRDLCRLQSHFGTQMEYTYSMMTFGIPQDAMPVDYFGNIDLLPHHHWLENLERDALARVQTVPSARLFSSTPTLINTTFLPLADDLRPQPHDIILGRGRQGLNSAGNLKLKSLVKEYQKVYEKSGRFEKGAIVNRVYKNLMKSGSKFMIHMKKHPDGTGGGWMEVDEDAARSKIAHDFRNLRLLKEMSPPASNP